LTLSNMHRAPYMARDDGNTSIVFELYEPTIFSLRRESRIPTYRGVAPRTEPRVLELNQQPDESYLLRKRGDPVTAIKRRLERLANEGRTKKSIREYKKD